jgi:hypothetical protein
MGLFNAKKKYTKRESLQIIQASKQARKGENKTRLAFSSE